MRDAIDAIAHQGWDLFLRLMEYATFSCIVRANGNANLRDVIVKERISSGTLPEHEEYVSELIEALQGMCQ